MVDFASVGSDILSSARNVWAVVDLTRPEVTINFSSFISADYSQDARVAEMPIEGDFATYNKVRNSYTMNVTLAFNGLSDPLSLILGGLGIRDTLKNTLDKLSDLVESTDVLEVITPHYIYSPVTLQAMSYEYKRELGGVILVRLTLKEVRSVLPTYTYSVAQQKDESNADTKGKVNSGGH